MKNSSFYISQNIKQAVTQNAGSFHITMYLAFLITASFHHLNDYPFSLQPKKPEHMPGFLE